MNNRNFMGYIRLILRLLFLPLWIILFFVYLLIWSLQNSWRYFNFEDYWDDFLILWDKIMVLMKLKNKIRNEYKSNDKKGR